MPPARHICRTVSIDSVDVTPLPLPCLALPVIQCPVSKIDGGGASEWASAQLRADAVWRRLKYVCSIHMQHVGYVLYRQAAGLAVGRGNADVDTLNSLVKHSRVALTYIKGR